MAQLITVAVAPLLTRLYSPVEFGLLAVFSGMLGVLSVISSLRYDLAVPLPSSDERAANVLALAIAVSLLFAILVAGFLQLWGGEALGLLGAPELIDLVWLMPVGVALSGIYRALSMWAVRTKKYRDIAATRMTQAILSSVVQLMLGVLRLGVLGLLIGQVVSQSTGITRLLSVVRRHSGVSLSSIGLSQMWSVAIRYRNLPAMSAGSALLNRIGTYLPPVMLVSLFGPSVGGLYFLTQRVIGLPSKVIGQAVQKTYFGEFARMAREEPRQSMPLFWNVVRAQAIMGVPVMLLIALPAPWLFSAIFGQQWGQAGTYLQILAPMFLLRFVSTPVGVTLTVIERQDVYFYREIARLILVVVALGLAGLLQVTDVVAVIFLSIAGSAGYLLHIFMSWWSLRNHLWETKV